MTQEDPQNKKADETLILGQSTLPYKGPENKNTKKKYEIIRPLGRGGFAWVYLVKNLDLDRLEAIKILASELDDDEVLDRFVKEARISANFNHQNIITIFEVQRDGNWGPFIAPEKIQDRHNEPFTYFTMSYVEGNTAAALLKKLKTIPLRKVLKMAIGAANALDYAHSKAVTHRDIKPENMIIDRHGEAILMDFGIAKAANQTRKTAAGTFMGTARYVSPEQAMGSDVDGRSDLYSLGITLYELAAGRPPFNADEWMTVLYQHIHETPPPLSDFVPEMDRDFQHVIHKLLEKAPKDRYQTAKELLPPLISIYNRLGGDEYGTEAMNQIATRADILKQATPSDLRSHPPVRKGAEKEKLQPAKKQETPKQPKSRFSPWFVILPAIILTLSVAFYFFLKPAPVIEGPLVPPKMEKGQLYISVFPEGTIRNIVNEKGERLPIKDPQLPQLLDLPPGHYTIDISHRNQSKSVNTFVETGSKKETHAYFEVDESTYLLEDLK